MKPYAELTRTGLQAEYAAIKARYEALKARGLKLDMSRGKPSSEQLDLAEGMLTALTRSEECLADGMDARNYGALSGLPSAKKLFAEILGCRPEECFMGGSSSLTLMYDTIARAMMHGMLHSPRPWVEEKDRKWLCPVPGYDRHFTVTGSFGFEMIPVRMTDEGPDMDAVEDLVKDPAVKGIWCVPKYSNPEGIIYSEEVINRLARMETAAPDFTVMWDNAYVVHEFDGDYVPFPDMLAICREAGHPDRVLEFASTSKVTFPGAGIAVMAASEANQAYHQKLMSAQLISYDKLNQLRHVRFLKDKAGTLAFMKQHAAVMGPKFKGVLDTLDRELAPLGIASWRRPKGGYFISFHTLPGLAKRTVALCKEAGVVLTGAGATWPGGKDPEDSNIRLAPSLPPVAELTAAMEVFCTAVKLAALEKML